MKVKNTDMEKEFITIGFDNKELELDLKTVLRLVKYLEVFKKEFKWGRNQTTLTLVGDNATLDFHILYDNESMKAKEVNVLCQEKFRDDIELIESSPYKEFLEDLGSLKKELEAYVPDLSKL